MSTPTLNLQVGQSVLIKASILDQNSNQIVSSPPQLGEMGGAAFVNWSSSDTSVATVTTGPGMNRGLVMGISSGTATLTATYTDSYGNTATQEIDVTIYLPAATSIELIYPGSSTAG